MELKEIYARYLEDRATEAEVRYLLRCFKDPAREAEIAQLVDVHLEAGTRRLAGTESELDEAVREIYGLLRARISEDKPVRWLRWAGPVAAVILAGALAMLFWTRPVVMRLTAARAGERKLIELSDGTKIWLSPVSSLEYPDQFNSNLREVKLTGEAYFEVAKDKSHPFIIHSDSLVTRVVGTSFTIRRSSVTVVTGLVRVSSGMHAVLLRPGQRGKLLGKQLIAENYPGAADMRRRREGILRYDGVPVREVVADLARYYKVTVTLEGDSMACLCYGEFNMNRPLAVVLAQLSAATGARYRLQADHVVLTGSCPD